MSDWLVHELTRELRPIEAPEGLWGHVQAGRRPQPARHRWLPAVTAAALLMATVLLWSGRRAPGLEALAARELDRSPRLELHSSDAAEIGRWLRREAGLDPAIPVSDRVRLTGARVIREHGAVVGEVAYRVGERSAVLLVAPAGAVFRAPARHGGLSWQSRQLVYALASSTPDPQAACALCHASL